MRLPHRVRTVATPLALFLVCLAAECGNASGIDCDPATILALALGGTVNETIDAKHCVSGDDPGDLYQFTLAQPTTVKFTVSSDKFGPEFSIARLPASTDSEVMFRAGSPARAFVYLAAGQYALDVQSSDNSMGAYSLATELASPTGCAPTSGYFIYASSNQTISETWTPSDCNDGVASYDPYEVYLVAGRAYTFTLKAAVPRLFLGVSNPATNTQVASSGFATNGTAVATYTPSASGSFVISPSPTNRTTTAPYTLQIAP